MTVVCKLLHLDLDYWRFIDLQYLFAAQFGYILFQFLGELSFLFFYRRVFSITKAFCGICRVVLALTFLQTIGTWIFYGIQCRPVDAFFNPDRYSRMQDACDMSDIAEYLPLALVVGLDFVICCIPIIPLWSTQLDLRARIKLIAFFALGFCTIGVTLARFRIIWELRNSPDDYTYNIGAAIIATSIELDVALITADVPGILALYKHWKGKRCVSRNTAQKSGSALEMGNTSFIGAPERQRSVIMRTGERQGRMQTQVEEEEEGLSPYSRVDRQGPSIGARRPGKGIAVQMEVTVTHEKTQVEAPPKSPRELTPTSYYDL